MRVSVVRHRDRRRRARWRRVWWGGGEVLVTVGAVLMLLVAHQLWWTNWQARGSAEREVRALERTWGDWEDGAQADSRGSEGSGDSVGEPSGAGDGEPPRPPPTTPSHAYAILGIPRLGLRVPVAEGIGRADVLDKGYVGHYPGTGQPGRAGNFALAGHRNTHGEPFRHLDRLRRGDAITVETADARYSYVVGRTLPRTSARDVGVIRDVPRSTVRPGAGYREPGYYITLTTCTPVYTSRYRLVVWGALAAMAPRAR
ncbi:class E sortase [Streptomyces broussonetiae]|uniref:Class E sortase n=1 Tax=Streptomyces broussonetiae TaxID=2686304 RepID=A0ABV5E852_9ACTN